MDTNDAGSGRILAKPVGACPTEGILFRPSGFSTGTAGFLNPESWKASVLIHLHPKAESPSLAQTLTISLAELECALAKDKLSGQPLTDFILEEMLADPMVRLFMKSDGVSEADMRLLQSGSCERMPISNEAGDDSSQARDKRGAADRMAVETAENEGMAVDRRGMSTR